MGHEAAPDGDVAGPPGATPESREVRIDVTSLGMPEREYVATHFFVEQTAGEAISIGLSAHLPVKGGAPRPISLVILRMQRRAVEQFLSTVRGRYWRSLREGHFRDPSAFYTKPTAFVSLEPDQIHFVSCEIIRASHSFERGQLDIFDFRPWSVQKAKEGEPTVPVAEVLCVRMPRDCQAALLNELALNVGITSLEEDA